VAAFHLYFFSVECDLGGGQFEGAGIPAKWAGFEFRQRGGQDVLGRWTADGDTAERDLIHDHFSLLMVSRRLKRWLPIEALRVGENPFDEATLEQLR
jgi:hypothetical protein